MYVVKRDGRKEPVMFDKITARIRKLCYGLNNLFLEFPDKGAVLVDPGLGLRRFRFGPVPQCIDTGIVVPTQVKKLGIFGHEKIYGMCFIRKPFSNMTCHVIHTSSCQSGFWYR